MSDKQIDVSVIDTTELNTIDRMDHGDLIEFLTSSFKYADVGGQRVIQTPDGLFVEHVLMEESYFVENWLTQFAIHQVGDKNYFNMEEWNILTDGFTKGVIVINENKTPVLIIRKFTDMGLSSAAADKLNFCGSYASRAHHAQDRERDELIKQFATQVQAISESETRGNTIPEMIPLEYYRQHGVDPLTMQQVIYIRDNYQHAGSPIDPDSDILKRVEKILFGWNVENKITADDKAFVLEITENQFSFDYDHHYVDTADQPNVITKPEEPETFDPLAD
ncbi:hypothetical protein CF8_0060 [Aeromonas phage CF8]|nr:hypothetical protein CF8_0060 [Aeromonas phage CF8]